MLDKRSLPLPEGLRAVINEEYRAKELGIVTLLLENAALNESVTASIRNLASRLVEQVRSER